MNGLEIESALGMRHPVSALTHLFWCFLSLFISALLVRLCRGDRTKQVSIGCFGATTVLLYGVSGLFHVVPADRPDLVQTARLIDLSAIYVLIAGSFTPVFAVLLSGHQRVRMLSLVWSLAAVGVACKWFVPLPPDALAVSLYLATGLAGFLPTRTILRRVGPRAVLVEFLGALLYTAGAIIDTLRWPVLIPGWFGPHEVLHVLDILGSMTHILFVALYVVPFHQTELGRETSMPMMDAVRGG